MITLLVLYLHQTSHNTYHLPVHLCQHLSVIKSLERDMCLSPINWSNCNMRCANIFHIFIFSRLNVPLCQSRQIMVEVCLELDFIFNYTKFYLSTMLGAVSVPRKAGVSLSSELSLIDCDKYRTY